MPICWLYTWKEASGCQRLHVNAPPTPRQLQPEFYAERQESALLKAEPGESEAGDNPALFSQ